MSNQNIKSYVRLGPLKPDGENVVTVLGNGRLEIEPGNDEPTKRYIFDAVFEHLSAQADVYKLVAEPLVDDLLRGINCTVFAYGQTGSGKTFTMEGKRSKNAAQNFPGIIPLAVSDVFDKLTVLRNQLGDQFNSATVTISYIEIYNEMVYDLLSKTTDVKNLSVRGENGFFTVQGMNTVQINSKNAVYRLLAQGSDKRKTAPTLMNTESSRSHSIFCITVEIKINQLNGILLTKSGKLNLVDLAGSENCKQSGSTGVRAKEAGNINKSLLTLNRIINELIKPVTSADRPGHLPYRDSKLTKILQDSLGGKTRTSIIATISPMSTNTIQTIRTLKYAQRAKSIKNKPKANEHRTNNALPVPLPVVVAQVNENREMDQLRAENAHLKAAYAALQLQHQVMAQQLSQDHVQLRQPPEEIIEELGDAQVGGDGAVEAIMETVDSTDENEEENFSRHSRPLPSTSNSSNSARFAETRRRRRSSSNEEDETSSRSATTSSASPAKRRKELAKKGKEPAKRRIVNKVNKFGHAYTVAAYSSSDDESADLPSTSPATTKRPRDTTKSRKASMRSRKGRRAPANDVADLALPAAVQDLRRSYFPIRCLECPMAWRLRDNPRRDRFYRLREHYETDPRSGEPKHWNQAYCFLCETDPSSFKGYKKTKKAALEHYREKHREDWPFFLTGPIVTVTKTEEMKKIERLVTQHCGERGNPNVLSWERPV